MPLPSRIESEAQLDDLLSEPSQAALEAVRGAVGDIVLLGAGGKMGFTLARMARRAADAAGGNRRVIAVSRFSNPRAAADLEAAGVEVVRGDLLDERFVQRLPDAANVIHMTGMKFGTGGQASLTWATNVLLPALICRRYRDARISAFSTGNVYPLVPVASGGCRESDPCAPLGEYAMTALGRERTFEYFSHRQGTPVALLRLNYAVEMRYGVLVDVALKVQAGEAVDVAMGYANVIWQADANAAALAALAHAASPPWIANITGPECVSIRAAATRFGQLLNRPAIITGTESETALLSDASMAHGLFGEPRAGLDQLVEWIADWVSRGGASLGKPTHFEVRNGAF